MPNPLTRLRDTIALGAKAAPLKALPFAFPQFGFGGSGLAQGNGGGGGWLGSQAGWFADMGSGGARMDYAARIGDLWDNSAVAACLNWLVTAFPEATPLLHERDENGKLIVAADDPLGINDLLQSPNDEYDDTVLWAGTLISYRVAGNAYWFIVRDGAGRPSELWSIPHFYVRPVWEGSDFISYYDYWGGGTHQKMPKEDVVHFRFGTSMFNNRLGWDILRSISGEAFTDAEATEYTAYILANMGVTGAVINPDYSKLPAGAQPEGFAPQTVSDLYQARVSGAQRGKPLVSNTPLSIQFPTNSPEKMALDTIRKWPEARICAVMGIPPMLVGLTSGLERSTFSNMEQAEDFAWRNTLLPIQRSLSKQLTMQLLRPQGRKTADVLKRYYIEFDTSRVRALQPDVDAIHTRARADWQANLLTRSEARAEAGMDSDDGDNIHYADIAPPQSGGFDQGTGAATGGAVKSHLSAKWRRQSLGAGHGGR